METNKIYQGDCLELMKQIEDKYFEIVITDPPYGITKEGWDKVPSKEYFDEIFRISKNQIIFGGNYFDLPKKEGWIIWYKKPYWYKKPCSKGSVNEAEFIWISYNIKVKVVEYHKAGNIEGFRGEKLKPDYKMRKQYFTSEKPVRLIKWFLQEFAKKGDKIFDPYCGSGSILVACKEEGFEYMGCEIRKEFVDITNKRLSQEILNTNGGKFFSSQP